jgi:hypothetical protein
MASTRQRLQGYIEKRILTEEGWLYFCSDCQDYHVESRFYRQTDRPYGIMGSCSQSKKGQYDRNPDKGLSHLKLGNISQDDIQGTIDLLETLGYNTSGNVHEQFILKHHAEINKNIQRLPDSPKHIHQRGN